MTGTERLKNALACAGLGAAVGLAWFGGEEALLTLLGRPPLDLPHLLGLLVPSVALPALLGALLGLVGFGGITAAIWLWAAFVGVMLGGQLGASWGAIALLPSLLFTAAVAVGALYATRESDDDRWGAAATLWLGAHLVMTVEWDYLSSAPIWYAGFAGLACIFVASAIGLGVAKALRGREPRPGIVVAMLAVPLWVIYLVVPSPGTSDPPPAGPGSGSPPVVLILVDGLRADKVHFFNESAPATPRIDALAAASFAYPAATATSPAPLVATQSVLSGQYPEWTEGGAQRQRNLAAALEGAGYTSAAVWSYPVYEQLSPAFQWSSLEHVLGHVPMVLRLFDTLGWDLAPDRIATGAEVVTDNALRFVQSRGRSEAWFLVAQYHDLAAAPPREYDQRLTVVDAEIGRLLGALPDSAWIFLVGTHGRNLGEHTEVLYQECVGVPILAFRPRNLKAAEVLRTVRTIDVAPTILTIAQIPSSSLDGEPLYEALGQPDPGTPQVARAGRVPGEPDAMMVRRDEWKLIRTAAGDELYNLALDPKETRNMASERPEVVEDLAWDLPGQKRPATTPPVDDHLIGELEKRFGSDGPAENAENAEGGAAPAPSPVAPPNGG